MKRILVGVAGLDVHRDTVVACIDPGADSRSYDTKRRILPTTTSGLDELRQYSEAFDVQTVVMEATGIY